MENVIVLATEPDTQKPDCCCQTGVDVSNINEFLGTIQASSLEVWKLHLLTNDYNKHIVLNEYYEEIVDLADDLIEHWMGANEKLDSLQNCIVAEDGNALEYLKKLRDYVRCGAEKFIEHSEIKSDVDSILALLDSTIYKLRDLLNEGKVVGYGRIPSYADFLIESETFDFEKNENDMGYDFSFEANDSMYNYTISFEEIPGSENRDVQVHFNFNVDGEEYDTTNDDYAGLNVSYVESVLDTICAIIKEYINENSPERILIHTEGNTMDKKYKLFINYTSREFGEDAIDYDKETNTIYIDANAIG